MKIYVEVSGGLANQLFQWAAGQILAHKFGAELLIDGRIARRPWERGLQVTRVLPDLAVEPITDVTTRVWSVVDRLGHNPRAVAKRIANLVPRPGQVASTYAAAEKLLETGRDVRLCGYFQEVDQLVLHRDLVAPHIRAGIAALSNGFVPPADPYIAVHVRRGDYVSVPEYLARFGACDAAYFSHAIESLDSALPVYVASDDHTWVNSELTDNKSRVELFEGGNMFADLMLLICAKNIVLSNSTFSWWATFLGDHENVVCPDPWFNDPADDPGLRLAGWMRVGRAVV